MKKLFSNWLLIIEHATGWTNAMTWRPIDEKKNLLRKSPGACVVVVCLFIPWRLLSLYIVGKKNSTHKTFSFFFSSCWPHWNFMFSSLGLRLMSSQMNLVSGLFRREMLRRTLPLDRLLFRFYFSVYFYILCGRLLVSRVCQVLGKCRHNSPCACAFLLLYLTLSTTERDPAGGKQEKKGHNPMVMFNSSVISCHHLQSFSSSIKRFPCCGIHHAHLPTTNR